MARILQTLGIVFGAFLAFVGLLHGTLAARHRYTPEGLGAFHEWPVIGGFFPKHVEKEAPETPEERRERDAALWLQDARNEFKLPTPFAAEQIETLVREHKDARSQADAARTRYDAERADLERLKKDAEADREALHKTADEIEKRVKSLATDSDELTRERTFVRAAEIKNFKTLATMYESMPAEDAAQRLDELDEETAAKLVSQMSERKAGRILAAMKTPRAVLITKKLQALSPEKNATSAAASAGK
jgi:flagellar motility protein MotE (MotC chaperone)